MEGAKGEEGEDEIEFVKDEEGRKGAESDEEEQREEEEAWVAAQGGGARRARMRVCGFQPTGWALARSRKDGQGKTVYEPWVRGGEWVEGRGRGGPFRVEAQDRSERG